MKTTPTVNYCVFRVYDDNDDDDDGEFLRPFLTFFLSLY